MPVAFPSAACADGVACWAVLLVEGEAVSDITLPRAEAEQIRQALASGKKLFAALAALDAALAEPVHPGYIIGSHWLETAYSRIVAGEAEADVLAEVLGARGWAKREPAMDEQVAEAYKANYNNGWFSLIFFDAWREAERFHGIRKEDGK
jgi:hypothetical protein